MKLKAQIMDEAALGRALMRISHEINEHNRGVDNVVLVGVRRRGEPIAQRIRGNIHKIEDREVPCGSLDIKYYRDDLSRLTDYPFWFALPVAPPELCWPSFYYKVDLWQYSFTDTVPGIEGETDMNMLFIPLVEETPEPEESTAPNN